ncbi:MAG TPA: hypothetical protein VGG75_24210 [Trebonia sp.]
MRVGGGHAAGLQERWCQQHGVVAAAPGAAVGGVQRAHLGDHMAAQRRVAAADQFERPARVRGDAEQVIGDPLVQRRRVGFGQAA